MLYAASARLLKDAMFVYVLVGGVALTGLLMLADHLSELLGDLRSGHAAGRPRPRVHSRRTRLLREADGPFSPAQVRAGVLLVRPGAAGRAALGCCSVAQICRRLAVSRSFKPIYDQSGFTQPEIVLRWRRLLALGLVLAGTYAYVYSDLVVRRIGVYIYIAVFTLLWAEVLLIDLIVADYDQAPVRCHPRPGPDGPLLNLAMTSLADGKPVLSPRRAAAGPVPGALPVLLGVVLHLRAATFLSERGTTTGRGTTWSPWWRRPSPAGSGPTCTGTTAGRLRRLLLRHGGGDVGRCRGAVGRGQRRQDAMARAGAAADDDSDPVPGRLPALPRPHGGKAARLGGARGHGGHADREHLGGTLEASSRMGAKQLYLMLSAFFTETTLFYAIAVLTCEKAANVYFATTMAFLAMWQLFNCLGIANEYYTLTFALVGLILLCCIASRCWNNTAAVWRRRRSSRQRHAAAGVHRGGAHHRHRPVAQTLTPSRRAAARTNCSWWSCC